MEGWGIPDPKVGKYVSLSLPRWGMEYLMFAGCGRGVDF